MMLVTTMKPSRTLMLASVTSFSLMLRKASDTILINNCARTMLYGSLDIHVYTDHKNNTLNNLHMQCFLHRRLFLEDFGVQLHYIKGSANTPIAARTLACYCQNKRKTRAKPSTPRFRKWCETWVSSNCTRHHA